MASVTVIMIEMWFTASINIYASRVHVIAPSNIKMPKFLLCFHPRIFFSSFIFYFFDTLALGYPLANLLDLLEGVREIAQHALYVGSHGLIPAPHGP